MTLLIMAIQIYHTRAAPRYATRFLALSLGMAFAGKVTESLPRSSSTQPTGQVGEVMAAPGALRRLGWGRWRRRLPPQSLRGGWVA